MTKIATLAGIRVISLPAGLLTVAALAAAGLWLVGFSQYPAAHDSFHDVRHALGFACH